MTFLKRNLFFQIFIVTLMGCQNLEQNSDISELPREATLTININSGREPVRARDPEVIVSGSFPNAIKGMYIAENDDALQSGDAAWIEFNNPVHSLSERTRVLLRDEQPAIEVSKTVHVWLVDESDNIYPKVSKSFSYLREDATPPNLTNIEINGGVAVTTSLSVDILIEGNDNIGITAYFLSEDSAIPSLLDPRWMFIEEKSNLSTTERFQLSASTGNNNRTVYLWLRDAYGNISGPLTDTITYQIIDTQKPVINSVSINNGAGATSSNIVSVSIDATDDYGIAGYLISESGTFPGVNDTAWVTVNPTSNLLVEATFTLTQGSGLKTVYVWVKDSAGNYSAVESDTIQLTNNITLGNAWMFFGDSQTAGRANEPDAVSHAVAFRNIWLATYGESISPHIDGSSGRTLPQTYQSYQGTAIRTSASWVHFQESGCQFEDEDDLLGEFIPAFENFVRDIVATTPGAVISTETAYSFEAENDPCGNNLDKSRDWTTYNIEMRAKIAQLASEGIVVHLAEVDRNIKELVARKRNQLGFSAGQQAVWGDTNNDIGRHYTGLGNLMVALSIYAALGYDVNKLDLSGIPDSQVSAADKQLCLDIINAY